jgi:hypothetical protein
VHLDYVNENRRLADLDCFETELPFLSNSLKKFAKTIRVISFREAMPITDRTAENHQSWANPGI